MGVLFSCLTFSCLVISVNNQTSRKPTHNSFLEFYSFLAASPPDVRKRLCPSGGDCYFSPGLCPCS